MNRRELLQQLINKNKYRKYLEIGVFDGETFLPLKCGKKIGVDPNFRISDQQKRKYKLKNFTNFWNEYYEMTSDRFFESGLANKLGPFDLIFIDGLHTFKASLSDTLHSMALLRLGGTIVLHDCFPPHKAAETPADSYEHAAQLKIENWTGEWCGDVWKTVQYLKIVYEDHIDLKVLNTDYGLGILQFDPSENLDLTVNTGVYNELLSLTYEDLISKPKEMINLKDIQIDE